MAIFADMGVPMLAAILPPAWLALVPIILMEAAIGVRIAGLPFRQAALAATIANLFSTLLGIPLAWLVMAVGEMHCFGAAEGLDSVAGTVYAVTVQSPWLIPYEQDLIWMAPVATVFLMVPLWMMSVVSEFLLLRLIPLDVSSAVLWRWMWKANAASYAFLALLAVAFPWLRPVNGWVSGVLEPLTMFVVQLVFDTIGLLAGRA